MLFEGLKKKINLMQTHYKREFAFDDKWYFDNLLFGKENVLATLPANDFNKLSDKQKQIFKYLQKHHNILFTTDVVSSIQLHDLFLEHSDIYDSLRDPYPYYYAKAINLASDNEQRQGLVELDQHLDRIINLLVTATGSYLKILLTKFTPDELLTANIIDLNKLLQNVNPLSKFEYHKLTDFNLTLDMFANEHLPKWDIARHHNYLEIKNYIPKSYHYLFHVYQQMLTWTKQVLELKIILYDIVVLNDHIAFFKKPKLTGYLDGMLVGSIQGTLVTLNKELSDEYLLHDSFYCDIKQAPEFNQQFTESTDDASYNSELDHLIQGYFAQIRQALLPVLINGLDIIDFQRLQIKQLLPTNDCPTTTDIDLNSESIEMHWKMEDVHK